ncbi:hypothetical protein HPP92_009055 [Vanilla planifolia]|uniref:At3g05675-like ankyrin-like domain-containing protein n=1 Tax=Vanilla planifolia TaxID=51239 RepID=A0A835RF54_VANPL|nr:hypothetical protein HPP92_009055 [Vanilla planifolia]
MTDPCGSRRSTASPRRRNSGLRAAWCCSFTAFPPSPDCRPSSRTLHKQQSSQTAVAPSKPPSVVNSLHSSPSPSSKIGLGIIDPRRILSPGRVSPIDSDASVGPLPENAGSVSKVSIDEDNIQDPQPRGGKPSSSTAELASGLCDGEKGFDLMLKVTDGLGRSLVMEMDSEILCANSSYLAGMVLRSRRKVSDALKDVWEVEVEGVDNLRVFRETIEMMYERDDMNWLVNAGVSRAIDVLEVSASIMFDRGTMSCLRYLEAVPWNEHEEEKLKGLFSRCSFDESVAEVVLARLRPQGSNSSEELAVQLIRSVANGTNVNARKELQALVNGLLSESSIYRKEHAGLNKESLYGVCCACMNSLLELFKEASSTPPDVLVISMPKEKKPLIERVSRQVENLNWLLEILLDKQMAEDLVYLWATQDELIRLHERTSPMIRYELSRISACVFIALGKGKLHCCADMRHAVLHGWFRPMLMDFGWLQRCSKGMDMRSLEEGLGQAILTLPLKQQQNFFVEWFQFFGIQGNECPNLSKAFQVWWRRSFVKSMEASGKNPTASQV